ncbi:MAG: hypothetical protein FWC42_03065 [Proteobacteria bacterium]|nr:hypothetical protein [Pseudomonadota bacterium]
MQAETFAGALDSTVAEIEPSNVIKLDPQAIHTYVSQVADNTGVSQLSVDGEVLFQTGMADALVQAIPSIREQVAMARDTGGDIAIRTADLTTAAALNPKLRSLYEHTRTTVDGMTPAEMREYRGTEQDETLSKEVEKVLAETERRAKAESSMHVVKSDILDQLNRAGIYKPHENAFQASFMARMYQAHADQINRGAPEDQHITAEQLYRRKPPQIVAGEVRSNALAQQSESTRAAFEKRIDELYSGAEPNKEGVRALDEGDVLTLAGYGNMPVVINERHAVDEGKYNHGLTAEDWKKVPEWLDNPVAMFERASDGNLMMIAPEKKNGYAVVIGLKPEAYASKGYTGEARRHLVLTVFPKDTGEMSLRSAVERGEYKPVYVDQKKNSPSFFGSSGIRFPGNIAELRAANRNIKTDDDLVKYRRERENALYQSNEVAPPREESLSKSVKLQYEKYPGYFPPSMPQEIRDEILKWRVVSKSPYSESFYDITNKSWDNDPDEFLRVADHWNFESGGRIHAKTDVDVTPGNWTLARHTAEGGYEVIKSIPRHAYDSPEFQANLEQFKKDSERRNADYTAYKKARFDAIVSAVGKDIKETPNAPVTGRGYDRRELSRRTKDDRRRISLIESLFPKHIEEIWLTRSSKGFVVSPEVFDIPLASLERAAEAAKSIPELRLLFQFAGEKAQGSDLHALSRAVDLENSGVAPSDILKETGWHKGMDGKWRFEISDKDARLTIGGKGHPLSEFIGQLPSRNGWVSLDGLLDHPALFAAYPELRTLNVKLLPAERIEGAKGSIDQRNNAILLDASLPAHEALSTLLHEIQHGIQRIEGFATGGTIAGMRDYALRKAKEIIEKEYSHLPAYQQAKQQGALDYWVARVAPAIKGAITPREAYFRLAGEVEARNTQARHGLTDSERLAMHPLDTADVKAPDVIVTFNGKDAENAPIPANAVYIQGRESQLGFTDLKNNTIGLTPNANLSTFLHETGHWFLNLRFEMATQFAGEAGTLTAGKQQFVDDAKTLLDWFGVQDINTWNALSFEEQRSYHEKFAVAFERYLYDGKAPSVEVQELFQRFSEWLVEVYKKTRGLEGVQISPEVRAVFDRMVASEEQIAHMRELQRMEPLFTTAEEAGMSPEEWTRYQNANSAAIAEGVETQQRRGLRDMRWLHNKVNAEVSRLQKEAKELRRGVHMEVAAEVYSRPVYQAWAFLTRKLAPEDRLSPTENASRETVEPERDTLFTAIAKLGGLDREQVRSQWGVDEGENIGQPVSGKPLLRAEGGRSIDDMAQALAEHGYLKTDENGNVDLHDFEQAFHNELIGDSQYSTAYDYATAERPGDELVNPTALNAGRLDLGALREMYGGHSGEMMVNLLKARRMTANEGLHPDLLAEVRPEWGYDSGDALVRDLVAAEHPRDVIETETDARMVEKYAELATPEAIRRSAEEAIHNEARSRMVRTESAALDAALGRKNVTAAASKAFAQAVVSRMKIRDITPSRFSRAAAKASRNAADAFKRGDVAGAEKKLLAA